MKTRIGRAWRIVGLLLLAALALGGLTPMIGGDVSLISAAIGAAANTSPEPRPVTNREHIRNLKIKRGHPILFADQELIRRIRSKEEDCARKKVGGDATALTAIRKRVDKKTVKTHPLDYIGPSMRYALDAHINDNDVARAYGRQYVLSLLDRTYDGKGDGHTRGKLFALGMLYDWLYDHLTPALRARMRLEIVAIVGYCEKRWHFFKTISYTGGHARLANYCALVALLPIRYDIEHDPPELQKEHFDYLYFVVRNWRNGYNPVHRWICENGGHHMGWAYGTGYTRMIPYVAWEYATDEESWLEDWQNQQTYWHLYALRNDNTFRGRQGNIDVRNGYQTFPYSGDVWGTHYTSYQGFHLLVAALHYNNDHAKWLYNRLQAPHISSWNLLYKHFDQDEGTPPDALPLSRLFPNAGFVIMRDSWDFDKNTLVLFKSSSFYSMNHHHKDQNSFTVF